MTIVTYKYTNPGSAGPFRGKIKWDGKDRCTSCHVPSKGDTIYMMFGEAVVTSVKVAKND